MFVLFFFFKQKTAYEMRISDWSSDVCSSDLSALSTSASGQGSPYFSSKSFSRLPALTPMRIEHPFAFAARTTSPTRSDDPILPGLMRRHAAPASAASRARLRSEEHTSELQSLMRISYAVFCLKKKHTTTQHTTVPHTHYR